MSSLPQSVQDAFAVDKPHQPSTYCPMCSARCSWPMDGHSSYTCSVCDATFHESEWFDDCDECGPKKVREFYDGERYTYLCMDCGEERKP